MSGNESYEKYNKPPIWSSKDIFLMGIIFSFITGGIMNIISYKRLGYVHKAKKRLSFLVLVIVGIFILSMVVNNNSTLMGINVATTVIYQNDQKKLFENHIKQSGKKASTLIPILVSTSCMFIIFGGLYWGENLMDESDSSYVYENYPELYEAIKKNDKFKGEFTLDFTQSFKGSYGKDRHYYAYNIKAQGVLDGESLRVISSYDNISKGYFRRFWKLGGNWQKRVAHNLYEDVPYKEVYVNDQRILKREGKDKPWTSTSLTNDNIDKSHIYDYNSFKGYRVFSLDKLIRASNEDVSSLESFKIEKVYSNGSKGTKYHIKFYTKGASMFLNPINDRVNNFQNTKGAQCDLFLYFNSEDKLVGESVVFSFNDYTCSVFYDIYYSHIGESFTI
ncbi:hypothetical protein [Anaeromicrobium sediminis]|uniref:Uncharacterized protein n=1 Tax=Anaeromicrobium sediminis TaxID=1478221 RepID=A0A267MEZ4_9FIRM|nr:hypothetical protein [Anaeromicrobium sediminis]PAB58116.1 hypothetical protein CCE28_16710 [Anaeromicrobium sediminis]